MAQAFGFVAEGTEAAGAAVDLVTAPATITCRDCGLAEETHRCAGRLPALRRGGRRDHRGHEMTLESITYEPGRPLAAV